MKWGQYLAQLVIVRVERNRMKMCMSEVIFLRLEPGARLSRALEDRIGNLEFYSIDDGE